MTDSQKIYAIVLAILAAASPQNGLNQAIMQRADQIMHLAFTSGERPT